MGKEKGSSKVISIGSLVIELFLFNQLKLAFLVMKGIFFRDNSPAIVESLRGFQGW